MSARYTAEERAQHFREIQAERRARERKDDAELREYQRRTEQDFIAWLDEMERRDRKALDRTMESARAARMLLQLLARLASRPDLVRLLREGLARIPVVEEDQLPVDAWDKAVSASAARQGAGQVFRRAGGVR